jgi:Tol biopolymer transport system component
MQGLVLAAGLVLLAFCAGGAQGAPRAYPGANGLIVFEREKPSFSDETAGIFHTDLWSMVPGRKPKPLLRRRQDDASPFEPDWSPDGRQLVFAMDCSNKYVVCSYIARANANGRGLRALPPPTSDDSARPSEALPAWSTDGKRIALVSYRGERGIVVMNAKGGPRTLVVPEPASEPAWSPDGTRLAFARDGDIWVVSLLGDQAERDLTASPLSEANPSWSPDGTWIAYDRVEQSGQRFVYVMRSDGSESKRLTVGRTPARSPDGRRLAFALRFDIWVMNADGSAKRRLTKNRLYEGDPAWQPLPRKETAERQDQRDDGS